jgi:adenylosuccinate synthase
MPGIILIGAQWGDEGKGKATSGIINPNLTPVIGNGVVVDPEVLFEEIEGLESRGVDCSKLLVSSEAHVIAPYHRTLDKVTERFLGKHKIGTTGRGIGPAYADKINRVGIRIHDLFNAEHLRNKVEASLHQKNQMLVKLYNRRTIDIDETVDALATRRSHVWRATVNSMLSQQVSLTQQASYFGHTPEVNERSYTDTTDVTPMVTAMRQLHPQERL